MNSIYKQISRAKLLCKSEAGPGWYHIGSLQEYMSMPSSPELPSENHLLKCQGLTIGKHDATSSLAQ